MDKKVLVIDTTSEELFLALLDGDKQDINYIKDCKSQHSVILIPEIDNLLKRNKLKVEDIDVVAISVGPGSFTGIRIGVTTAKAFQLALKIKVVAINSLEACAYPFDKDTLSIIDAKHGNAYVGLFQNGKSELGFYKTDKVEELKENKLFVSPYQNTFGATIVENYYDKFIALIKEKVEKEEFSEDFAPLYLKLSQAEEEEILNGIS